MEINHEFLECLQWAGAAFVCGIVLREWGYDALGKWIGRANVAAALFVMSAFGLHSVRECSTLVQLAQQNKSADEIDHDVVMTFVSPAGNKLVIEENEHGMRRVSSELRRSDGTTSTIGTGGHGSTKRSAAAAMGVDGSADGSSDGRNALANVSEWARWISGRASDADSRSFELSGEAQGQTF